MANIKFISYDGEFPNLCSGVLTLEIDGAIATFGSRRFDGTMYDRFWYSGGSCHIDEDGNDGCRFGPWRVYDYIDDMDDNIKPILGELIKVFNENVRPGCCGGCI